MLRKELVMKLNECFLCQSRCHSSGEVDLFRIECPRCGGYEITEEALLTPLDHFISEHLYLASAVARHSWDRRKPLRIDSKLLRDRSEFESRILSLCPRGTQEKMNVILRYIAGKSRYPGDAVVIVPDEVSAPLYCRNGSEVRFFLRSLSDQSLIRLEPAGKSLDVSLSAPGWRRVEELERPNIESKQAFVAMWFDEQMDEVAPLVVGIRPAVG
jgi:hypothetical protein